MKASDMPLNRGLLIGVKQDFRPSCQGRRTIETSGCIPSVPSTDAQIGQRTRFGPGSGRGPDQPFGCNRMAAKIGAERGKLAIKAGEGVIDHLSDLAQHMLGRDAFLKIDTAKQ